MKRAGLALLAALAACGGGQTHLNLFATDWEDDGGASIERVRQRLGGARPAAAANVVIGVAGESDKVIGVPLGGGAKWSFTHAVDWRPVVAGEVVVVAGGREVVALDAKSGKTLWVRETGGLPLRGAGDDGAVTVMTFSNGARGGTVLLAVQRDGTSVRQIETDKELGVPAVLQGLAFVPWGRQYVSVIDLSNGDEAARVTMRETTSRAWAEEGALWFGEKGMFRFDDRIGRASRGGATHVSLPARALAGSPELMVPGTFPVPAVASSRDEIRLFARPAGDASGLAASRFYATDFRVAMAFDSSRPSAPLAWARPLATPAIAGAAYAAGVVLCEASGKISVVDAGGATAKELDAGEPLKGCTVSVDAFDAPAPMTPAKPLADQIADAIAQTGLESAAAQRLLLHELAAVPGEAATKVLLALANDRARAPEQKVAIGDALAARRDGADLMLAALDHRYDWLRGKDRAPAVAPLARALGAMKDTRAAAPLARALLDPACADDDVRESAHALAAIATPAEVPALRQFFGMYRASVKEEPIEDAVAQVAAAWLRLDPAAIDVVERAAKDETTPFETRRQLLVALSKAPSPPPRDAGTD